VSTLVVQLAWETVPPTDWRHNFNPPFPNNSASKSKVVMKGMTFEIGRHPKRSSGSESNVSVMRLLHQLLITSAPHTTRPYRKGWGDKFSCRVTSQSCITLRLVILYDGRRSSLWSRGALFKAVLVMPDAVSKLVAKNHGTHISYHSTGVNICTEPYT
jgi:hypothetical protein